jgi:hypothetical protein
LGPRLARPKGVIRHVAIAARDGVRLCSSSGVCQHRRLLQFKAKSARAGMVRHPRHDRWSTRRNQQRVGSGCRALRQADRGGDAATCGAASAGPSAAGTAQGPAAAGAALSDPKEIALSEIVLRLRYFHGQWTLGAARFAERIEEATRRSTVQRPPGRPQKATAQGLATTRAALI